MSAVSSANKEKKADDENYWVVGLNKSKLFCVVCKTPDLYPMAVPKPVLSVVSLSFLVASSDLGPNDLENEFLMNSLHLSQIQMKIEEAGRIGVDATELDDEAFNIEAALDRCILRLIASCCNGDKLVRAVELAHLLSLEKSLKGAIKLVTALKLPILAEQFNAMLEEKLLRETSVGIVGNIVGLDVTLPCNGTSTLQSSPSMKLGQEERNCKRGLEDTGKQGAGVRTDNVHEVKSHQRRKPFVKASNEREEAKASKKEGGKMATSLNENADKNAENGDSVQRPKNPFAKSSNKEKSSLFDSIKKMKVDGGKV